MTTGEFKAFVEGMGIETNPTPEQWERIKSKMYTLSHRSSYELQSVQRDVGHDRLQAFTYESQDANRSNQAYSPPGVSPVQGDLDVSW